MCQTFFLLLRAGPQNNARLKSIRSWKRLPTPGLDVFTYPLDFHGKALKNLNLWKNLVHVHFSSIFLFAVFVSRWKYSS